MTATERRSRALPAPPVEPDPIPTGGAAVHPVPASDPLWFKRAVYYELLVRAFADSNGDGVGDFRGLIGHLDYLEWLGVDCIWLLPFNQSPLRDGGYDISDYYDVLPDYGTVDDVREFVAKAHERGMRVIMDLVINHTSDQHPWFKQARSSLDNPYRDWYMWSSLSTASLPTGPGMTRQARTTGIASSATSPTSTTTTRRCARRFST